MHSWFKAQPSSYWLTRDLLTRALGFIYFCAFYPLSQQYKALLGEQGILPISKHLHELASYFAPSNAFSLYFNNPTLFWISSSDSFAMFLIYFGIAVSLLTMLGFANSLSMGLMWLIQLSIVYVGQDFWSFGWESNLLEIGFLGIFLVPFIKFTPLYEKSPPSAVIMFFYRWALFRLMLGAGLIKLRGDACWLDLSCLNMHFETQPMPNPLSFYLHQLPDVLLKTGTLLNHGIELLFPCLLFAPRKFRALAGTVFVGFQLAIMAGGNYGWINAIAIVMCIPCFDDGALKSLGHFVLTKAFVHRIEKVSRHGEMTQARKVILSLLTLLLLLLSIKPTLNLLNPQQVMNTSYEPFHLVNSYGVFGSITKERYEVIIMGTEEKSVEAHTQWKEYEFPCKPGDLDQRPCIAAPYHHRLGWQLWFAAMSAAQYNPWFFSFVDKLLQASNKDAEIKALLLKDPFPDKAPLFIKADLYRYEFTSFADHGKSWYKRKYVRPYLSPVSLKFK